jgi:uncharacterized lipoprotein YddW (UPF0748 family)
MYRRPILLLTFLLSSLCAISQVPKHEVRAVWLTTLKSLDWPGVKATSPESIERQKQQFRDILDRLGRTHVNTILLQTRIRATTLYPSRLEPWDGCLTGKGGRSPGYDPLQFAIDECHKRGMELHAWVVSIPVGKWNEIGCKQLRERHPRMVMKVGDEGYMNPESSETATYLAGICREIVDNYDVDGIHLDYIRYPENMKLKVSKSQGRENITRIVRTIHERVKSVKPWVKLSCSPIGKFSDLPRHSSLGWNAYDRVCQDAQGWLRDGLMDQLYPMMYFKDDQFYPFAADWASNSYGRTVAPGLGVWLLSRREGANWSLTDITRELNVLRQMGMGHTYFRSRFFTDDTKGVFTYVERYLDTYPSLTPPMTWQSSVLPTHPEGMALSQEGTLLRIRWWGGSDRSGGPYLMYNVYADTKTPVDVGDARNLVAKRLTTPHLTIDGDNGRHYFAVTSIDRFGNESEALQSEQPHRPSIEWLPNDGRQLQVPPIDPDLDCSYLSIVSLAGTTMTIRPVSNKPLSIRRLPEGVYILNAMDKKKRSRRLGQFLVKRQ